MKTAVYRENIKIALKSIRTQLLRTILTGMIIALGITALVGILTSIDAIKNQLTGQFALLGANTFTIRNRGPNIQIGRRGKRPKPFPNITFYQALEFKEKFKDKPAAVSVSYIASGASQVKYRSLKTNPNITVWAADENYVRTAGYEMEAGRNITENEVESASPVALIGQEIKSKLFPSEDPIGKIIELRGKRFRIIGLMKPKGNAMGFGGDKSIFIPITNARASYSTGNQSFSINVMALTSEQLDYTINEATLTMRKVRRLNPKEEDNFGITKSDNLSERLIESLGYVTLAAIAIGSITLLGAAIALMNIMLVSVTERTREIGIRKAIGAKSKTIRVQFLTEAIVICLLGGAAGVLFGIGAGNLVSMIIGGSFIIPWAWMTLAFFLCIGVGLVSGIYPAVKAARLDPIEALRHE